MIGSIVKGQFRLDVAVVWTATDRPDLAPFDKPEAEHVLRRIHRPMDQYLS